MIGLDFLELMYELRIGSLSLRVGTDQSQSLVSKEEWRKEFKRTHIYILYKVDWLTDCPFWTISYGDLIISQLWAMSSLSISERVRAVPPKPCPPVKE